MSTDPKPLSKMVHKLGTRVRLEEEDRAAILALPYVLRTFPPTSYVIREGLPPKSHCSFIVSGFAFRQKLTADGQRQIVSVHMQGDFLDLQSLYLNVVDHNVQALTELHTAEIDRKALENVILERPNIGRAMWIDALVDASIFREWIVNVGRRDARARIAHLLCEFSLRMEAAGMGDEQRYELPLTQEQLGDAVGLTSVHVNRTLKSLAEDGLVHRDRRYISFRNWERIRDVGDFSSLYLHLNQAQAA